MSTPLGPRTMHRYLPYAITATVFVVLAPLGIVGWLDAQGLVQTPLVSVGLAVGLSWATSMVGSALWMRHSASSDIVFSDLMIWGWVRRTHQQRRITETVRLLSGTTEGSRLGDAKQRIDLLGRLAADLEARDHYTHGHSRRVTRHAAMTAKVLGVDRPTVDLVRAAALVHDVGKLHVSPEILNKAGKLTDEEFAAIKEHPVRGAEMVESIGNAELTAIVRSHHERLDGLGYPDGLQGERIPLGARIVAVCDTFDAITSSRPYRPAAQHSKAIEVLKRESGTQLDRDVVEAFMRYYSGRRSLAWWAFFVNFPERLIGQLPGSMRLSVRGALNSLAAVATTVVVGAVALMTSATLSGAGPARKEPLESNQIVLAQVSAMRRPSSTIVRDLSNRRDRRPSGRSGPARVLSSGRARQTPARLASNMGTAEAHREEVGSEVADERDAEAHDDTGNSGPSASDTSGSDTSGSDTSGSDTSGSDTSGSDTSGSDTSGSDTSGSDTSGSDTSGSDSDGSDSDGSDSDEDE